MADPETQQFLIGSPAGLNNTAIQLQQVDGPTFIAGRVHAKARK